MINRIKHVTKHMRMPGERLLKGEQPGKEATPLKEQVVALGAPSLSFLANLHSVMGPVMGMLMKAMMLTTAAGVMSATRESPWIRRSLLTIALLGASFTVYRLLSRKHTRWTFLLRGLSVLFTLSMITWSIATFGF